MEVETASDDTKLEIYKELDLIKNCSTPTDDSSTSRSRSFDQRKINNGESLLKQTLKVEADIKVESLEDCDNDEDRHSIGNQEAVNVESEVSCDGKRSRRNSKRRRGEEEHCPVCSLTLRPQELKSHFDLEVEKLDKIPKIRKRWKNDDGINTTFVQVRSNRQNRLSAKVAQFTQKAKNEIQCGICKVRMSGDMEEMNKHVALCTQHEEENEEYVNVEDELDESTDEYEIGNESRIRAVDLVPGGYRTLQGGTSARSQEIDEDLNVDVDDTMSFGQPQYTEIDVIPNCSEGDSELQDKLRKAVLNDPEAQPKILETRKWVDDTDHADSKRADSEDTTDDHVVSSLKEKIKEMEQQNSIKCLICMEPYTKPVVSTTCWHVHCEECWLMTMGVKKLCPQCNMIVFPTDLRQIFL